MFRRLCHLFVHALPTLQVAPRMYDSYCMSLAGPCAAREKHRFAAGKERKKTVWQHKKTSLAADKSCLCSGEKRQQKMPLRSGKNAKKQEKTPCSSKKAGLQQKKCILEAAGKNRPRRENPSEARQKTGRGRKKTCSREAELCNPKRDSGTRTLSEDVGNVRVDTIFNQWFSDLIKLSALQETRTSTKEGTET